MFFEILIELCKRQAGYFRVTTNGNMAKERIISPPLTMEHPGFIYIFLYNRSDSPNWVFFDDFKVTHQRSPIVAGADFYPFGLVMDGREITDEAWRYGYQGQFAEKDSVTGWNQFQLRMYDPQIGRWISRDPYNQYHSPYIGMGNNPVSFIDPDGGVAGPGGGLLWKWIANPTTVDNLAGYWARTLLGKALDVGAKLITPLTTSLLREIAIKEGVPPNQPNFNRIVGSAFEEAGLSSFGLTKNTRAFNTPERALRGGSPTTIPDGVRDVTMYDTRTRKRTVYRNSSFFEAKAVNGTINLGYERSQILGIMEAAKNSPGGKVGKASVTFITTANTTIGADVIEYAYKNGISVHQSVAFQWGDGNNVVFGPAVELTPGNPIISPPTPSIFAWPRKLNFKY